MAGLADFLLGGAGASAVTYDPQLSPEANALAGAKPPAPVMQQPAAPDGYQKPKGVRNTVGVIADVLAVLGGRQPMYSSALRQQEADYKAQQAEELAMQKQNVLGAYLADPSNPELQKQAFKVAPLETFKIVTELTPKAQNPGSVSDFQYVVRELQNQGVPPQEALAQARKILSTGQPALRTVPGVGLVDASDPGNPNVVMPSVAAPPAPQQPRTQVVTVGDRQVLVDLNTGNPIRDLGPAAPKGTGGGTQNNTASNQLAVLDTGLARLNNAIAELEKGNVSGPVTGLLPDAALNFTNPRAVAVAEDVASVSQQELRAILGGQFARAEGEQLIKRQYNPGQSEAENLRRLKLLRTQIETRRKQLAGGGAAASPSPAPAAGGFKVVGKRKPQ
jgi:hypothetical protein